MKRVMAVILSACLCLGSVNFVLGDTGNENWKSAYINYLRNGIKNNWAKNGKGGYSYEGYALIDIDGNDIPELYMMGNSTASGDKICTYNNGKVVEAWGWVYGISYVKGKNLLNILGGHMDVYFDHIYKIENGEFVQIHKGDYGAEDNSNVKFDENDMPIYKYEWDGKKVSKSEYESLLNSTYNQYMPKYAYEETCGESEIFNKIANYKSEKTTYITVILNGNKLTFSENPYIENGTTMVPMRAIFEALGASVNYDTETKAITATKGSTVIKLFANSDTATVNGKEVTLMSPVANKNGTTMVPLRLVSEALGAEVSWDAESKIINISISEKITKEETSTIKLNELDETYSGEVYDYEKNYIEAHQKFINSDDYKNITSYACAEEIGNGIKNDSKIQNAKLGNHAVHLFKDYFKNYYDIALADVLIKQSTYDKYELMFKDGILKNQKSICDDIINIVKDDWGNDFSKKDESIIRKILTTKNTEDYANDPIYTKLSSILEKHMNQEQITNIFNATGKVSNAVELFNKASNIIDAVQNTMNYSSALNAYLDTSDEFKKVLVYTDINPALKYKNGVDYALLHESINRYLEIYNEENVAKEVANKALYEGVVATYSIFKDEWINSIGNFIYTSAAISGSEAAVSAAVGKVTGAITIGYEIGTAISDVLFKNNEKVALLSTLEANGFLAENAKKALDSAESEFLKNPSYENAKIFDEAFNFYKGIQIYSCDKAIEYDKQIKGLLNIFKWKSLDENIKFAEETKKEYEDLKCH